MGMYEMKYFIFYFFKVCFFLSVIFKHPFSAVIAGSSGVGKTEFCIKLIKQKKDLICGEIKQGDKPTVLNLHFKRVAA